MSNFQLGFEKRSALRPEAQLQPHQQRVKERIGAGQSLLLYHGLGSGKTLSSIAATEQPGKKVDVVVPASLRENYKKELHKFTKGKDGPERSIKSYEGASSKGLAGGDVLVADEIQRINNSAATRSQAIVNAAPSYKQRILLTGTPIKNSPSELAPIIRTLNPGSKIPLDPEEFNKRFLQDKIIKPGLWNRMVHGAKPGVEVSPKNLDVLRKAVHGHIDYHAPEKNGYPSTSEQIVKVPMSEDQARVYSTVTNKANKFVAWKVKHNMPLSKQESKGLNHFMTAARVVSNTTTPYGGEGHSPKFERASADMAKHLAKNPRAKALVYSNYLEGGVKEYSKYLQSKGITHHIFTGELNDKKRKQMVEDYNNDKVKALLISGAGSEGLDLKGTRLVQVLEPHWNKQRIDQAVGRAVRFKSHAHLPPEEQHVHIMHYHSTHAPSFVDKIFHTKPGTSADEFLHGLSQKKEKINQAFLDVLQSEGERASKEWQEQHVKEAGALGTTENELNAPFIPPGSSFAPSSAHELVRNKPLVPPVSMDTQEGSPTGFRKEAAWLSFEDIKAFAIKKAEQQDATEFTVPGSAFRGVRKPINDVSPDQVPPVAYEPQNLNSFYTGDERKHAMQKTAFEVGFEKKAYLADTHVGNAGLDALAGLLPFGTTIGTAVGSRPAEHSRSKEWVGRVGGALGGALLGSAVTGGQNAGSWIGHALGEGVGSYLTTSDMYDAKGNLKSSVRKQMK